MLAHLEQKLVQKGYVDSYNPKDVWSYHKKDEPLTQIHIIHYPFALKKKYKFSFPISHGQHFATYFDTKEALSEYVSRIVNEL